MDEQLIKNTANLGLPALQDLFSKLPKEEALKGLGILVIAGFGCKIIDAIKEIVMSK